MATAECGECGHSWELTKPPGSYREGPKCSKCGNTTDVEVERDGTPDGAENAENDDGPVLKQQGRKDRLREALSAVPGVGEAGVEYAARMYDMTDASEGPEALYEVVSEIDGVSDQQARRVADAVFQVDPDSRDPAPFDRTAGSGDDSGDGESFIDKLAKAREAGLLGDGGGSSRGTIRIQRDDGTTVEVPADHPATEELVGGDDGPSDAEAIAAAVSEAISPALNRMSKAMRDDGDTSEVEELREEIRELKEDREKERLEELREEIREVREESGEDAETLATRKSFETLRETSKDLKDLVETLNEDYKPVLQGTMKQQARAGMMGQQAAQRGQPGYVPEEVAQHAGPQQPQQQGRREGRREPDAAPEESGPEGPEDFGVETPDGEAEEQAEAVREELNLASDGGGSGD